MIGQDLGTATIRAVPDHGQERGHVDHRDTVGSPAGHQGVTTVGGYRDVVRIGERGVGLVEQHLIHAPVLPQHPQTVGDDPALGDTRHGNEVLRAHLGEQCDVFAGNKGDPLQHVGPGDPRAPEHARRRWLDRGDLGNRWIAEAHRSRTWSWSRPASYPAERAPATRARHPRRAG